MKQYIILAPDPLVWYGKFSEIFCLQIQLGNERPLGVNYLTRPFFFPLENWYTKVTSEMDGTWLPNCSLIPLYCRLGRYIGHATCITAICLYSSHWIHVYFMPLLPVSSEHLHTELPRYLVLHFTWEDCIYSVRLII